MRFQRTYIAETMGCGLWQKQGRLVGLQLCGQAQLRAMASCNGSWYVMARCMFRAYLNIIFLMEVQRLLKVVVGIQAVHVACSVLVPLVFMELFIWPCTERMHLCAGLHNRPNTVSRLALGQN